MPYEENEEGPLVIAVNADDLQSIVATTGSHEYTIELTCTKCGSKCFAPQSRSLVIELGAKTICTKCVVLHSKNNNACILECIGEDPWSHCGGLMDSVYVPCDGPDGVPVIVQGPDGHGYVPIYDTEVKALLSALLFTFSGHTSQGGPTKCPEIVNTNGKDAYEKARAHYWEIHTMFTEAKTKAGIDIPDALDKVSDVRGVALCTGPECFMYTAIASPRV